MHPANSSKKKSGKVRLDHSGGEPQSYEISYENFNNDYTKLIPLFEYTEMGVEFPTVWPAHILAYV